MAILDVDLRKRKGQIKVALAVVAQFVFKHPCPVRNRLVILGDLGSDRFLQARFIKHEAVVFPDDLALDMHERIEQPVVCIDQIHAGGGITQVVIKVLDRDRSVGAVEGKVAVDRKRTLAVSGYVAEAAELDAAGSATNNEIIDLSCTIDANPTFVIKL